MSVNQRLRQVRKHLKMQQIDFAKRLGLSQAGISWLEQEGNTVSEQIFRLLHLDFHVSEEWLRTGEGPMFFGGGRFAVGKAVPGIRGVRLRAENIGTVFLLCAKAPENGLRFCGRVF